MKHLYLNQVVISILFLFLFISSTVQKSFALSQEELENMQWKIFTYRERVEALELGDSSLWVGTTGGLELRDATSGKLKQVITTEHGLPGNYITALMLDAQARLWIGTKNGLSYMDTSTFKVTNLSRDVANAVTDILKDHSGGIWISSEGGGLSYRNSNNTWKHITEVTLEGRNITIPLAIVWDMDFYGQEGIWIGSQNGLFLYRYATQTWELFDDNIELLNKPILSLAAESSGGLWVGAGIDNNSAVLMHRSTTGEWERIATGNDFNFYTFYSLLVDQYGGLWIGSNFGLVYRDPNGTYGEVFNFDNKLPGGRTHDLRFDNDGSLLVAVGDERGGGALRYRIKEDDWYELTLEVSALSELPDYRFNSLAVDNIGNRVWAATPTGLVYRQDAVWKGIQALKGQDARLLAADDFGKVWIATGTELYVYKDNTLQPIQPPPFQFTVNQLNWTALATTKDGTLWIGTKGNGLAYLNTSNPWKIFQPIDTNQNSAILAIAPQPDGGIWAGVGTVNENAEQIPLCGNIEGCLVHYGVDGNPDVYTQETTIQNGIIGIPSNDIRSLLSTADGSLWVGTSSGLTRRNIDGTWTPILGINGSVIALHETKNGMWVGVAEGGLHYYDIPSSTWTSFRKNNSSLMDDHVTGIISDKYDDLWISTHNGLARLAFPGSGQSAAILIAGGGNTQANNIWDTTEAVANRLYNSLIGRNLPNNRIYYLSPKQWADFNGDGYDDGIVDAPKPEGQLKPEDVHDAFIWAKSKGQLSTPLYVFLIDHGDPDKFQLAEGVYLTAQELKSLLDDYQQTTGNAVIVAIDACHSGAQIPLLVNAQYKRAIITSTDDKDAYFDQASDNNFMGFLAKGIEQGRSFKDAFDYARGKQQNLLERDWKQIPQLDDNGDGVYTSDTDGAWLQTQYLNTPSRISPTHLETQPLTGNATISAGTHTPFKAKISLGRAERVWAVVRPSAMPLDFDANGIPVLDYPSVELRPTADPAVWETVWKDSVYNGNHQITLYAKDNDGNIENSNPIVISVYGGIDPPPHTITVSLNKAGYRSGDHLVFSIREGNSVGYDLYGAVVMPNGVFYTFPGPNQLSPPNTPQAWQGARTGATALDLPLPALPAGQYCFFGILSPQGENVLAAMGRWVMARKCVEIQ